MLLLLTYLLASGITGLSSDGAPFWVHGSFNSTNNETEWSTVKIFAGPYGYAYQDGSDGGALDSEAITCEITHNYVCSELVAVQTVYSASDAAHLAALGLAVLIVFRNYCRPHRYRIQARQIWSNFLFMLFVIFRLAAGIGGLFGLAAYYIRVEKWDLPNQSATEVSNMHVWITWWTGFGVVTSHIAALIMAACIYLKVCWDPEQDEERVVLGEGVESPLRDSFITTAKATQENEHRSLSITGAYSPASATRTTTDGTAEHHINPTTMWFNFSVQVTSKTGHSIPLSSLLRWEPEPASGAAAPPAPVRVAQAGLSDELADSDWLLPGDILLAANNARLADTSSFAEADARLTSEPPAPQWLIYLSRTVQEGGSVPSNARIYVASPSASSPASASSSCPSSSSSSSTALSATAGASTASSTTTTTTTTATAAAAAAVAALPRPPR